LESLEVSKEGCKMSFELGDMKAISALAGCCFGGVASGRSQVGMGGGRSERGRNGGRECRHPKTVVTGKREKWQWLERGIVVLR
jgi:hypothetical protein